MFNTAHKQKSFLKSHPLYEEPKRVILSSLYSAATDEFNNEIIEKIQEGYYISFLQSLKKFVVAKWDYLNFEFNEEQCFNDVFHGKAIKCQMKALGSKTLAIGLYHDEFEVTNPIGSNKKKHNVGNTLKQLFS